ncbi:hypothetical protein [Thermococcus sp. ES12]|uniref:hypothetical protein n=1 Tax=Thermococcus sp. ES12 TaxID=1638246 RepID=UPI001430640B|nr:hypothetical protein [Thermococcus sp. ES12]NJE76199.1 hypothetical protein [Thermococcus sp. ES12]
MKRLAAVLALLLLLAPLTSATPYWFKEGIYAKYVSRSPANSGPGANIGGGNVIQIPWEQNGSISYYCPYVELTWRVLKVTGDKAQVGVLLQGINCTRKVVKVMDEETARELLRQYQEKYSFSGGECVRITSETGNVTVCEDSYTEQTEHYRAGLVVVEGRGNLFNDSYIPENFTRSGTFELDLKTGDIYVNGIYEGMNFFWTESPANVTGLEILPGLKVETVKMINSTAMTYYGDFNAPVYMAYTNMMNLNGTVGKDVILYDGSSGLAIAFFTPFSPVWKALGISNAVLQDTEFAREHEEDIKKGNKMPPFGLALAETNIDFTQPAELPEEGPSKTAIMAVAGIVVVLGVLVLWRWRR